MSEKFPKFKAVPDSNIGYGHKMERVDEDGENYEVEPKFEPFALTGEQRKKLRAVLLALGIALIPAKYLTKNVESEMVANGEQTLSVEDSYEKIINESYASKDSIFLDRSELIDEADDEVEYKEVVPVEPEKVESEKLLEEPKSIEPKEPPQKPPQKSKDLDAFEVEIAVHHAMVDSEDVNIMKKHADKPVVGAKEYNRKEYVQKEIEFEKWNPETEEGVPPVVQEELRNIIPGLCAQESRFNNSVVSKVGAKGIMQFKPDVWKKYGGKPSDFNSLKRQVEIAGKFFSDLYKQINYHIGKESLSVLQSRFADEESFQRDLLVPLIVNSYNVGAKRMSEAVRLYVKEIPVEKMPNGKELYLAIADHAISSKKGKLSRYGEESREYVAKTYAQAEILKDKKDGLY
jgi:hypothetical protein